MLGADHRDAVPQLPLSCLFLSQELEFQKKRPQEHGDKFVSVVSQFITVASFGFSDVEDSLTEAKELVSLFDFVDTDV